MTDLTDEELAGCVCWPGEGCDEEGEPGCIYCRELDCYELCPGDLETLAETQDADE